MHGFRYFAERDVMGFVDGTENPEDQEAVDSVFTPPGGDDPEGSTYVIVQKHTHDMAAWEALSVEDQAAAFGRHKLSDMEFPDEDKAPNSHLILNTIEDEDGTEHKIVRDNMASVLSDPRAPLPAARSRRDHLGVRPQGGPARVHSRR